MRVLRYRSDWRSVVFVGTLLTLLALQWTGVLRHPLVYLASLQLTFMAAIVNHNHQHHPTFVGKGLNRFFGILLSLSTGQPALAIVPLHNENHHPLAGSTRDFVRVSIVSFRWNLANLIAFPFVAVRHYARAKSELLAGWKDAHPGRYRQLVLERCVLYPALALVLLLRPVDTLAFVVLPWLFGQWSILAINLVQHDGCDPASEFRHSRDIVGPVGNWFFLNNGFHTVHHRRPGLHWSLLAQEHGKISAELDPNLVRRSLIGALFELYLWPGKRPARRIGSQENA